MTPMRGTFFVAGTDTGVGKTYWSVQLLRSAAARGTRVLGLKPVAAGAQLTPAGWRNDDALALQAASTVRVDYDIVNPVCLPLAASPHLAARQAGVAIDSRLLAEKMTAAARQADLCLIEGAGGWRTPISDQETMADLAVQIGAPVLLVVGIRLGCLNHAQLTADAIRARGLTIAGWIANEIAADHQDPAAQVDYLSRFFGSLPCASGSVLAS